MRLTCGEETTFAFNGAQWLAANKPDLIAAEFALNEGGGGRYDRGRQAAAARIQVGEKAAQNYTFETTNPGGHSSQPTPDNAIYELADALQAVRTYEFPVKFTDTTRAFFGATAAAMPGPVGDAIKRLLANPEDKAADALISRDKAMHSTLRTTYVATLVNAGHAENALPQRATANVNCRIFPGETVEATFAKLKELAGPKVKVTINQPIRPTRHPAVARPEDRRPGQGNRCEIFPGPADAAADVDRRDRRHLLPGDRHPGLRRARHLRRRRPERHPRPERADQDKVALWKVGTISTTWSRRTRDEAPPQTVTCSPSSSTLPGGMRRKSVGSLALRCRNMKIRSCHSGMPWLATGFSVLRPMK